MDANYTYWGHHCTVFAGQAIMLYPLNLHSGVCQLDLNKTGKRI